MIGMLLKLYQLIKLTKKQRKLAVQVNDIKSSIETDESLEILKEIFGTAQIAHPENSLAKSHIRPEFTKPVIVEQPVDLDKYRKPVEVCSEVNSESSSIEKSIVPNVDSSLTDVSDKTEDVIEDSISKTVQPPTVTIVEKKPCHIIKIEDDKYFIQLDSKVVEIERNSCDEHSDVSEGEECILTLYSDETFDVFKKNVSTNAA